MIKFNEIKELQELNFYNNIKIDFKILVISKKEDFKNLNLNLKKVNTIKNLNIYYSIINKNFNFKSKNLMYNNIYFSIIFDNIIKIIKIDIYYYLNDLIIFLTRIENKNFKNLKFNKNNIKNLINLILNEDLKIFFEIYNFDKEIINLFLKFLETNFNIIFFENNNNNNNI
jgi:hypothetical protein